MSLIRVLTVRSLAKLLVLPVLSGCNSDTTQPATHVDEEESGAPAETRVGSGVDEASGAKDSDTKDGTGVGKG
jgi:hypothetical protein